MTKLFEPHDDGSREQPPARLVRPPRERGRATAPRVPRQPERPPEESTASQATRTPEVREPAPSVSAPPVSAPPEPAPPEPAPPEPEVATGHERDDDGAPDHGVRRSLPRVSLRALLVALAAVAVVVSVGRGLVGLGGDGGALDTDGPADGTGEAQTSEAAPRSKPTPRQRPVVIEGTQIRPAGVIITLNPALAQPGASVGVSAVGFDAGSTVDVSLKMQGVEGSTGLGSFKVDRQGGLNVQVTMPQRLSGGTAVITARQRNSDKVARAEAAGAAGIGFVELAEGQETGEPGDAVTLSARGFDPGEQIKVYWGRASGRPATTLTADGGGGVSEASVRVGTGAVGNSTLVLVGADSGTTATAPFFVLGLYPTVNASPFAVKAKEVLNISGSGFAPDERVLVYINASSGTPLMTANADAQGNLGGVGFEVPYGLRGPQSLVMVGELSRASVSSGFEILPYTPSAQPSTYGGSPGTSFSFYATGFGPEEVVEVFLGRGQGNPGELVTAFRVDERGDANAAGSYMVRGHQQGKLTFTLIGRQSRSRTAATFSATAASGPVDIPEPPPYTLPPHLAVDEPPPDDDGAAAPRTQGGQVQERAERTDRP